MVKIQFLLKIIEKNKKKNMSDKMKDYSEGIDL
jgi:hypothetical protein